MNCPPLLIAGWLLLVLVVAFVGLPRLNERWVAERSGCGLRVDDGGGRE